jgi:hypothetical protein
MGITSPLRIAVAVVAAGTFGLSTSARADDSARIAALEAKLAQLESQQSKAEISAAQGRAVDRAIADADTKGRFMMADGFVSGWDNGFKLGSADGEFLIQPFIEFQFRNVTNYADELNGGDSDLENGFENRRLKFGARGNLFNKDFTYMFRFQADRDGGDLSPDYAYATYKFADDWSFRFGQTKLNWTHEETTADTKQLAAERSLLNQIVGGNQTSFVQGASLIYGSKDNPFRGEVQYTDGDATANTDFTDQQEDGPYQDFGVAVRAEYKFMGDWDAYSDFTARKTEADLLVVGAGLDWAQGGDGDVYRFTADGQWENTTGLGAYASVIYTIADGDVTTGNAFIDKSIGGLAQVSYLLPNATDWEVFGRYDITHLDEDFGDEDNFHEFTAGVNKYYYGHNAKLTLDAGYYPNGTPVGASGLGMRGTGTEDQIVIRAQFQLVL